jgi:murein L,D-transpeptidase YafK
MRLFLSSTLLLFSCFSVLAQWSSDYFNLQKNFPKVNQAITNRLDSLQLECAQKQIGWPIQQIYLRSFKENNLIEVWVKDDLQKQYKFLKFLTVCSKNGKLGPKRKEGDKQVPEGFYIVDRFNPNSNYHLSLGISYPNVSDRILSDAVKPGGDIYIHGDCVSVGCLAINDIQIEDLYVLSVVAKASGQEFIPVHIFPGRFNDKKSKPAIDKIFAFFTIYESSLLFF